MVMMVLCYSERVVSTCVPRESGLFSEGLQNNQKMPLERCRPLSLDAGNFSTIHDKNITMAHAGKAGALRQLNIGATDSLS